MLQSFNLLDQRTPVCTLCNCSYISMTCDYLRLLPGSSCSVVETMYLVVSFNGHVICRTDCTQVDCYCTHVTVKQSTYCCYTQSMMSREYHPPKLGYPTIQALPIVAHGLHLIRSYSVQRITSICSAVFGEHPPLSNRANLRPAPLIDHRRRNREGISCVVRSCVMETT